MIKEYWSLIGWEPFLASAIFGYNLRTRFFQSMQFLQNVNEPYELSFDTNSRQN